MRSAILTFLVLLLVLPVPVPYRHEGVPKASAIYLGPPLKD